MTIRGYSGLNFEEKVRFSLHKTVLAWLYLEEKDELILSGQGFINSWKIKTIQFSMLPEPKEPALICDVNGEKYALIYFQRITAFLLW